MVASLWRALARWRSRGPAATTQVDRLEQLLLQHDPVGLDLGDNRDEYRPEAESIARRRQEAGNVDDVRRIVHEEFVHWFDADLAGPSERYTDLAREVWTLWSDAGRRR